MQSINNTIQNINQFSFKTLAKPLLVVVALAAIAAIGILFTNKILLPLFFKATPTPQPTLPEEEKSNPPSPGRDLPIDTPPQEPQYLGVTLKGFDKLPPSVDTQRLIAQIARIQPTSYQIVDGSIRLFGRYGCVARKFYIDFFDIDHPRRDISFKYPEPGYPPPCEWPRPKPNNWKIEHDYDYISDSGHDSEESDSSESIISNSEGSDSETDSDKEF